MVAMSFDYQKSLSTYCQGRKARMLRESRVAAKKLTLSFSTKALAVRRVTENGGEKTPRVGREV